MGHNKKFFVLLLLLCGASTCWAGDSSSLHDQNLAIHTYGGGELLQRVFQSISMLLYGNDSSGLSKTMMAILRICLAVGGFCSICVALFRHNFEPLIKNFFLPGVGIMCCLLVPRTTVYIKDHLAEKAASSRVSVLVIVPNVPFVLGKLATIVSTVSYKFTEALETIAHGTGEPGSPDTMYDWTGHIYAGDNIFQTRKCRIANPILEDNFREFCRECVFRDLGIGIYSKKELLHASDILEFLAKNTSRIRTCFYREVSEDGQKDSSTGSFLPCREAIKKMNALFDKHKGNTKEILIGEIGSDFQYLLNKKKADEGDLQKLIKQQIAISLLKEEVPGTLNSFASKRAELLQKENQKTLGALGVSTIVAMRNYFEAVIYMVFPLVILISLLSFGLKPLINWTHFILWVNTWPPFYVVIKFLLNTIWAYRTKLMFGSSFGLTVFTSEGLTDLYSSMESIAAMSLAFVPFLSWMILQGGVSQMVHLASSLMSPAQSAAATASTEKVYGNYNFGNVSLDNINGYNAQTFRQTYSGMLATGSVSLDSGTETMTYAPSANALYVRQGDSHLREGVSRTQAFSSAVQDSLTTSQSALMETSKGYSENLSDSTNKTVGLVHALSKQFQKGENFNTQSTTGLQDAVQYIQGVGNDYAKAAGINHDQALREVVSAGIGLSFGLKGDLGGNAQDGVTKSGGENVLEKSFDSTAFQKQLQTLTNTSSGEIASVLGGEDMRLHEDFSSSFNETRASSEQYRAALSEHEALSKLTSYSTSDNLSIHQNLNQRFVEFLDHKYSDGGIVNDILEMPSESPKKDALIKEFVHSLTPKNTVNAEENPMESRYDQFSDRVQDFAPEETRGLQEAIKTDGKQKIGRAFGETEHQVAGLKKRVDFTSNHTTPSFDADKLKVEEDYTQRKTAAKTEVEKSLFSHFSEKTVGGVLAGNIVRSVYNQLFGSNETPEKPGGSDEGR